MKWTKVEKKRKEKYRICGCHWCVVTLMDVSTTYEQHRIRMKAPSESLETCRWRKGG